MKYFPYLLFCLLFVACQQDAPLENASAPVSAAAADSLSFEHFSFRDSAVLVPGFAGSPLAIYAVSTLVPSTNNAALNNLIQTALGQDIAGDNAPIKVTDLPQTLRVACREVLFNYRKQDVDTSDLIDQYNDYMLELSYETEALLNTGGLLSLATLHYAYTGGVHGNYYTTLQSFATDSLKLLTYDKVFLPEQATALSQLLTKKAVEEDITHDPEVIPVTKNFAFTTEGILFDYPPYEIASYAQGEIQITLPYEEISHLMTGMAEELVLQMRKGMVAPSK